SFWITYSQLFDSVLANTVHYNLYVLYNDYLVPVKNPQKRRKKWCVGPEKVVRKPCEIRRCTPCKPRGCVGLPRGPVGPAETSLPTQSLFQKGDPLDRSGAPQWLRVRLLGSREHQPTGGPAKHQPDANWTARL